MANIELVIKIDESKLWSLKNEPIKENFNIYELASYIDKGTPLPKGHGDLIDRKELLNTFWTYCREGDFGYHQAEDLIKSTLAIIKADKARK